MLDRVLNTSLFSSISQRRLKKVLISTIYLHISKCRANSCWFASEICRYFWIIMAGINNLLDIMNIPYLLLKFIRVCFQSPNLWVFPKLLNRNMTISVKKTRVKYLSCIIRLWIKDLKVRFFIQSRFHRYCLICA